MPNQPMDCQATCFGCKEREEKEARLEAGKKKSSFVLLLLQSSGFLFPPSLSLPLLETKTKINKTSSFSSHHRQRREPRGDEEEKRARQHEKPSNVLDLPSSIIESEADRKTDGHSDDPCERDRGPRGRRGDSGKEDDRLDTFTENSRERQEEDRPLICASDVDFGRGSLELVCPFLLVVHESQHREREHCDEQNCY